MTILKREEIEPKIIEVWESTFEKSGLNIESTKIPFKESTYLWAKFKRIDGLPVDISNFVNTDICFGIHDPNIHETSMIHLHPKKHEGKFHHQDGKNERLYFDHPVITEFCASTSDLLDELIEKHNSKN